MTTTEIWELMQQYGRLHMAARQGRWSGLALADVLGSINWAKREIAKQIRWRNENVAMTLVADQPDYRLDDRDGTFGRTFFRIDGVFRDGLPMPLYDWGSFESAYPQWRVPDTGSPSVAAIQPGDILRLHVAPDSTNLSTYDYSVAGFCDAPDMTTGNDVCELPTRAHEAIAIKALIELARPVVTEMEIVTLEQRLEAFLRPIIDSIVRDQEAARGDDTTVRFSRWV